MATPISTARRNLVGRIERFLNRLDREPDGYEGEWALRAIMHLKHDEWPLGEQAMLRADRPDVASKADLADIPVPIAPIARAYLRDSSRRRRDTRTEQQIILGRVGPASPSQPRARERRLLPHNGG